MPFPISLDDFLTYSDRDRQAWHAWFRQHGPATLAVDLGAHNSGRILDVGQLVRHIFSAEKRYVQRSLQVPLMDTSVIPADDIEALFAFGRESRRDLRELVASFPATEWDAPRQFSFENQTRTVTSRTMILQAITHELRHWAQIATYLRQAGYQTGCHDLIC